MRGNNVDKKEADKKPIKTCKILDTIKDTHFTRSLVQNWKHSWWNLLVKAQSNRATQGAIFSNKLSRPCWTYKINVTQTLFHEKHWKEPSTLPYLRPTGDLRMRWSVGGSVANASAPRVSMIKLTHKSCRKNTYYLSKIKNLYERQRYYATTFSICYNWKQGMI